MDRFELLRTARRVAELKSFTRAADDLEISRALVSAQVRELERSLGVRLFNRTTRRVSVTSEGSDYLERARRVLAELEAADDSLRQTRDHPRGRLRVDVPVAFGRHLLIPALPGFLARYPELQIEVGLNDRVVDLLAERVDIALRVVAVREPGLIARRVVEMKLVTCASPGYLLRAGMPRGPEDLRDHDCIGTLSAQSARLREWVFQRGRSRIRLRPSCRLAFNQTESVVAAGLADGGIFQTVDMLVADHLANGRLRTVLPDLTAPGPTMSLVYPQAGRQQAKVRVFADFAEKLLRDWSERVRLAQLARR
jgi:DNA-binding transcriptional LysR family regulator